MAPSTFSRVAVVTGANKGIGLAIVRQLALQYPSSPLNNGPVLIYLAARDKSRGEAAVKDIHDDPQLAKAQALDSHGGLSSVKFRDLDIADPSSVDQFVASMKKTHPDGIDIVINNAGMAMNGFDLNVVKTTLGCNYYGTLAMTEKMLPHILDGGRLVNVASVSGHLGSKYSESIKKRFLDAKSVADVNKLMEDFAEAVAKNEYQAQGWPGAAYAVSKAGTIGFTKVIAREQNAKGSNVLINVCCPGWVKTDMTKGGGSKTPDEGAMTPVMLALGDIGGKTGAFWQHERVIQW
jgi:carbonyl reductase 1